MSESRRQRAAGTRRRRTSRGTELSREVYVDAAANLIENRGAAVLSARTLAAAVGADPTALYRYFTGVDDVVRAVADRMIGMGLDRWSPGTDWLESLAGLARVLFAVYAQDFPRAGLAVASRATGLPNEIRAVELTLGLLRDGGFDEESAARWFGAISGFVLGQAMFEGAVATLPADIQSADKASWQDLATRVPDDGHPHTQAAASHLGAFMVRSSFELVLELILKGLAASAP
ncbi:TetR/AcrR family transcriptional regulator [Mycolicibacterium sp. P1-18]|uniref:TetR/AcrR family transcriptional regulator n=1 Tax=Mycolicibacterium sp. P1-18 TaxID=2024615 RepID=UPI0011F327EC|nr:TetR/AcrR family transcriptional regulator [Mycolicibacterium sp. P1-18]KAA0102181.1 TetR/AcrR family transcriptional regulator [Mycolicibacterium sp. P1-18]